MYVGGCKNAKAMVGGLCEGVEVVRMGEGKAKATPKASREDAKVAKEKLRKAKKS